jgi:hypothetical protein
LGLPDVRARARRDALDRVGVGARQARAEPREPETDRQAVEDQHCGAAGVTGGVTRLHISMIRRDGGTQMRVDLNQEAVAAYAERMEAGDSFPPVVVFHDGSTHWLADGFHRVAAAQKVANDHLVKGDHSKWSEIAVDIHAGDRQQAIRYAISANRTNGLRRTNADKQIAVRAALAHPDMCDMTDQAIADEAGVSRFMVQQSRPQVAGKATSTQATDSKPESKTISRTGVDGKTYRRAAEPPRVGRPPSKTPEERRESDRIRMAEKRAVAKGGDVACRVCPMCAGKGYLK